jgi:hypothetical protein
MNLLLILAVATIQTNRSPDFFLTLPTTAKIYTNAHVSKVTPAYLIVHSETGVEKVYLETLKPPVCDLFPFDTNTAKAFMDAERKASVQSRINEASKTAAIQQQQEKQEAAQIEAEQSEGSKQVRVVKIGKYNGAGTECTVLVDGNEREILAKNLPETIPAALQDFDNKYRALTQLEADILRTQARLETVTYKYIHTGPYDTRTTSSTRGGMRVETEQSLYEEKNHLSSELSSQKYRLEAAREDYDSAAHSLGAAVTAPAHFTGKVWARMQIWDFAP